MIALPYLTAFFLLFFTTADIYFGRLGVLPVTATFLTILCLVPMVGIIVFRDFFCEPKLVKVMHVINQNISLISCFVGLVVCSLIFSILPSAYWGDGAKWIFLISYGFIIFFLSTFIPILTSVRTKFRFFLFISLFTIFSTIVYELYDPGFFSTVTARAAGLPGNSNFSALVMAILCSALLRYDISRSKLFDAFTLCITGLGIFLTLSRSGLIEFSVIIFCYLYFTFFTSEHGNLYRKFRFSIKRIIILFIAISFLSIFFISIIPWIIEDSNLFTSGSAQSRLSLLTGNAGPDYSGDSRRQAIVESLELINQAPIFGHGTARSRLMAQLPHNMYLNQWVNNGIFGLALYVALLLSAFLLFKKRNFIPGQVFILVVFVGGFFSHNILDQRPFLILLGMLSTISLYREIDS